MTDLSYPIGKFSPPETITEAHRTQWVKDISDMPALLRNAVTGLNQEQLDTPYRPGGWTVRQVVHHVPDSHLNSYVRFKWTLTEDKPTIKAYDEASWATLADSAADIELSLSLLDSLHARWVVLLTAMSDSDYEKSFVHPESGAEIGLSRNLGLYSWHGSHHVAHVTSLRERMGW